MIRTRTVLTVLVITAIMDLVTSGAASAGTTSAPFFLGPVLTILKGFHDDFQAIIPYLCWACWIAFGLDLLIERFKVSLWFLGTLGAAVATSVVAGIDTLNNMFTHGAVI